MKRKTKFFVLTVVFVLSACAGFSGTGKPDADRLLVMEGSVQEVAGADMTLALKMPDVGAANASPVQEIAGQIVRKSLLIEGMPTEINGIPAVIREIRGTAVKVRLEKPAAYNVGSAVTLKIPKKTIAVVDFEVIKGAQKEAGRVTLEGLTSALVDTGQFIVVERSKLKSVMAELQLSLSGMTKERPDQLIGNLFVADLILTGTLAETQGEWDINLRIVSVRSGQIHAAVAMKTRLFKASEIRDAGPWQEDFEGASADPSWQLMYRQAERGTKRASSNWRVSIDRNNGFGDSKKSLRIDIDFHGGPRMYAHAENRKKRDLSLYTGVEFYIRATERINVQADILTSLPDDANKIDYWTSFFEVDKKWEKIRIPFDKMVVGRGWIRGGAARYGAVAGDQVLRLFRVEAFMIGIDSSKNPDTKATVWVDKIQFYKD